MAIDDFSEPRSYRSTEPFDPDDVPRFGQLIETAKDAIASELKRFFDYKSEDIRAKIGEFPTIEKFAHSSQGSTIQQSMETVMNLIISFGDTPDKYPMIAITSASSKEKVLGLGDVQTNSGQRDSYITAENKGPFVLEHGWTLKIRTWPLGTTEDPVESTILFNDILFPDITNSTVDDVIKAINAQMLYSRARKNGDGFLQVVAGGPAASGTRNGVEVIGGTRECLLALGYKEGQVDLYTDHTEGIQSPIKRYAISADVVVNVDVISDDLNTRGALADLVQDFFTFYMAENFFQMFGRSYENPDLDPPEFFQIILERRFAWAGEYNVPRQGGEQKFYIHSVRGSVPLIIVDFINRPLNRGEATFIFSENIQPTEDLPQGDYFGTNYLRLK